MAKRSGELERYRRIFDESPQPMWLFDEETLRFVNVNQAAIAVYGYSRDEFLHMEITAIRPSEDVPRLVEHIRAGGGTREWKHRTKSGELIDVEVVSTRLMLDGRALRLVSARDVSTKRALEEQLRQTQKIETVGQLAGGIAHDFNNLLTTILGHVELLTDDFAPGDPRAAEVLSIRHAAEMAAALTEQLLAFSRTQMRQPTVLDPNDIVERTGRVLQRLVGAHIVLDARPWAGVWRVRADAGQLEQILLNLAANARDAMPDGGLLTLRTRNVHVDEALAERRDVEPGDYVELSIADTGAGIEPGVRAHLFEPFFTTKERGRGTGLGLATVYGIVKQSGGHIKVESEVGYGSRFAVYLPATLAAATAPALSERGSRADRGSETVLLVEDDEAVRALIGDVLRRRGYQLLVAEDGPQALRLADEHSAPIDLLIADILIPGMDGIAVADALRERRPDTRVLYVSASPDDSPTDGARPSAFLHKPFTPNALARKVRAVLELQ